MPHPDWHILGPGAIGSLFAWHLDRAGHPVHLIARPGGEEHVRPITLDDQTRHPPRSSTRTFHLDRSDTPIHHLLVTVKAHQTATALEALQHRITPDTLILFLQNGMGTWACADRLFPRTPWLVGTTTEGAWRASNHHVIHAGRGETWLGSLNPAWAPRAHQTATALESTALHPRLDPLILPRLWRKLAINCAINPLTVLYDCRNGELLHNPAALHRMDVLCREVEQVMSTALGGQPVDPLLPLVQSVAEKTGANRSSMLQDYRRGQPTEIDFITGYLVKEGKRLGIAVPENAAVLDEVRERSEAAQGAASDPK